MKKNKLFLITICFCLTSLSALCQEHIVKLKPILGQGYLVLNKANYPSVDHWDIDIIKRSHGKGEYQDQIIESEELAQNINYKFIPIEYRKESTAVNYLVNIRGVSVNGQTIVVNNKVQLNDNNGDSHIEQTIDGSHPAVMECEVICVSNEYSYGISQHRFPNENPYLKLREGLRAFDEDALVGNAFYKYSSTQCGQGETNCFGPIVGSNGHFFDSVTGFPLSGNVYARKKGLGIWTYETLISNKIAALDNAICYASIDIDVAIYQLETNLNTNLSTPNHTPLVCDGEDYLNNLNNPLTVNDIIIHFCTDENGCDGDVAVADLLDPISEILIYDLNTDNPPMILDVFENPNELTFNLEPGLYSFGFVFKDGDFVVGIKEFKNEFSYGVTRGEDNLVDIEVFPTPIVENEFWITMKSQATTSFRYELRDANGRLLVDKTFEIEEGNNVEELINEIEIPRGLLFHIFKFRDGSIKTIKSYK